MGIYDGMDTSYMDSGDWSGIDVSGDQGFGQLDTPDMSGWDSNMWQQSTAPSFGLQANDQNTQTLAPTDGSWGNTTLTPQEQFAAGQMPTTTNWNPNTSGGIQNTLANLFNNKSMVTGLGALAEGYQNKKKAAALQQLVSQMRQPLDPFGSQRPQYQAELSRAVQDPYSSPIVSAQVEQLKRAQNIKDAQAGRRSNSATSSPALLAAQAQVAQKYIDSLYTPSGANIGPQGLSSLLQTQQQGINSGVNGYMSPLLSALAKNAGTDQNTQRLEALKAFLAGGN